MRRALVVEDELPVRDLLRLHLELAGFEVEESGDGREALRRLRESAYNLVILDVMLPGLDGVSLCRAIRTGGPNVSTPILMLTARDTESDKVLGLESGADDYLTKPSASASSSHASTPSRGDTPVTTTRLRRESARRPQTCSSTRSGAKRSYAARPSS